MIKELENAPSTVAVFPSSSKNSDGNNLTYFSNMAERFWHYYEVVILIVLYCKSVTETLSH